jgi:DAK2 domain fusion protein YloV
MTALDRLGAGELRLLMTTYRDALKAHREVINRLNVYPVPDGDTGTNMGLTLDSVVAEIEGADAGLDTTCKAISHGSLMGARGNSGVILSQVLRGMASVFGEAGGADGSADVATLARALSAASEAAYQAVLKPVEGTILTVVRESSAAAAAAEADGGSLLAVAEAARAEAERSLARTPELLPVLAESGVVDAGGTGYVLLLDALLHVIDGRPLPEPVAGAGVLDGEAAAALAEVHAHADHGDHDISDLRYEVMYFLDAPDESIDGFKQAWAALGDSIVVVGGDGIWNCHVHTDDIGAAVEAGIAVGRPHRIRVTDLLDEVAVEARSRAGGDLAGDTTGEDAAGELVIDDAEPVPTAVVGVATGRGVMKIFRSLGVRGLVVGGQTMNPSTAQLLEAVERVPAPEVVILPNNKNIIPVAEQVDAQTAKTVRVVRTTSIVEGFASLIHYDPEASAADNAAEMQAAAAAVISGEVTRAVRDSSCDLGPIAEGDFIGIGPAGICAIAESAVQAAVGFLDATVTDEHEIVTIIEGDEAAAADTGAISSWLESQRPDVVVEIHQGGQPLYPYLFGIE